MAERDYDAIAARIEACLREHLPDGYRFEHVDRARGWVIVPPTQDAAGECEYGIWVTADCEWIQASYGNSTRGNGLPWLQTLSLPTTVLAMDWPGLGDPLTAMLASLLNCPPNLWTLT